VGLIADCDHGRYIHHYNTVSPDWPGFTKLENSRMAVVEAIQCNVALGEEDDLPKEEEETAILGEEVVSE